MMTKKTLDFKIAMLMDGPNMFTADINEVHDAIDSYGKIAIKEIFLTKQSPGTLLDFYLHQGYQPVFNSLKDVDTALTVRASEIICSPRYQDIGLIAIVARDSDYLPLIHKSKLYDKKILVVGMYDEGMSMALKDNADYFEAVRPR